MGRRPKKGGENRLPVVSIGGSRVLKKVRISACGMILAVFTFAGAANAAPITQTIDFTFDNFEPGGISTTPSLVTEAIGSVSFTYDTATPTSPARPFSTP
mgnify:CR=1 FL=1|jgi:hypothetical protein